MDSSLRAIPTAEIMATTEIIISAEMAVSVETAASAEITISEIMVALGLPARITSRKVILVSSDLLPRMKTFRSDKH